MYIGTMDNQLCTSPLCDRPGINYKQGVLCQKHWHQIRRHGRLTPEREHAFHSPICLIKECGKQAHTRNLCTGHYTQVREEKTIAPLKSKQDCWIVECDRQARTKGLCQTHHKQYVTGIAFRPLWFGETKKCVSPGCTRDHYSSGLCSLHYEQKRNFVSVTRSNVPCLICQETRGTQRCHIIPRREGGTESTSNILYLCPTHHWCYDHQVLTDDEWHLVIEMEKKLLTAE